MTKEISFCWEVGGPSGFSEAEVREALLSLRDAGVPVLMSPPLLDAEGRLVAGTGGPLSPVLSDVDGAPTGRYRFVLVQSYEEAEEDELHRRVFPAKAERLLAAEPARRAAEAEALIRMAYDARFGGTAWQRRAHAYLWDAPPDASEPAKGACAEFIRTMAKGKCAWTPEEGTTSCDGLGGVCAGHAAERFLPAPPAGAEVREAAEAVRTILTAHDARLSESGALTYGPPSRGTGFVAAIQWLRRYDAARRGE